MNLVLVTALIAACGADKLDRTYLPPASAHFAGGSPGSLQTPFRTFNQGLGGFPKGSFSNDFEGVVVDAVAPGTRASGSEETGLGGPRIAYGSINSKVGDAAFTADAAFPRIGSQSGLITGTVENTAASGPSNGAFGPGQNPGSYSTSAGAFTPGQNQGASFTTDLSPDGTFGAGLNKGTFGFGQDSRPERVQASRDRASNTVKYESDVSPDKYNYAFETDNGIIAEENGIEVNGVKAQGGYSYTGDDGQVYSVTYTADEDGYRPSGDHLPTPPPIPEEILKSLEKNAQDEAAGVVDDGSYDAQKYNTGQDYTKNDNDGEYDGSRPIQLGNKPQSDPEASGSFVSQNNQGFVRPTSVSQNYQGFGFNQFGSKPTYDSSNKGSNGNVGVNAEMNTKNDHKFSSGFVNKNEYLPPSTTFNQNRRPVGGYQGIQGNLQNGFPISTVGANSNSGISKPNSGILAFTPLSQQKLQDERTKRPQAGSPIFGKPTIIDSTLSIKDPFASRPSNNRFTQSQKPNLNPQKVGGSFEVVSGNVFSSKNEYLPPRRQNNGPNQNKGSQGFQVPNSNSQSSQQSFGYNSPSTSAFASVSRPSLNSQSNQQYGQQSPESTGNFILSPNNNYNPFNKDKQPSSSLLNLPGYNKSPISQTQNRPSTFGSQSPTKQSQTELTTPLESISDQSKASVPVPVFDGPDAPNPPKVSFDSQQPNSYTEQNGLTNNKDNQFSPTQASALTNNGQTNAFKPGGFQNNLRPQISNATPDGQYASSTQKPNFSQYNQQQGSDDSYIYNTPSRPFSVPTPSPQASRFPSSAFDQSRPQLSDVPERFTSQSYKPGTTRYPTQGLGAASPTLPSQQNGNNFQSQFNKVTQASATSFPSAPPTAPTNFYGNLPSQNNQFNTRPQKTESNQVNDESKPFLKPGSSFAQASATLQTPARKPENYQQSNGNTPQISNQNLPSYSQQTQQYNGAIYEYKKPPQIFPPVSDTSSGQFGKIPQFDSSVPATQSTQPQNSGAYKPFSQLDSKITPQTTNFGQPSQNLASQGSQGFNQLQTGSRPGQFGSQAYQGNQAFNVNGQVQNQPHSESRPMMFGSQASENQVFNINNPVHSQPESISQSGQFNTQLPQGNQLNFNSQLQSQSQSERKPGQFHSQVPQGNQALNFNAQSELQTESRPGQFGSSSKPNQSRQPVQGASRFPPTYNNKVKAPCCKLLSGSQSSQADEQTGTTDGQSGTEDERKEEFQITKPAAAISSFAGTGEAFGGPRKPPSFDKNGYHY